MKRLFQDLHSALLNLLSAKVRSLLAVLGILVGTAAVVTLISCTTLASEKALAQFKGLGMNLLGVSAYSKESTRSTPTKGLSVRDWQRLSAQVPGVLEIAPYSASYEGMSLQGREVHGVIVGADESLANLLHLHLSSGHFVSFVESTEHFCVLGWGLADQLKSRGIFSPLGHQLKIGQALYTVIGVLEKTFENGFFNEDINQSVFIPLRGMALVTQDETITHAVIRINPELNLDSVVHQIKTTLEARVPKSAVFIRTAKQMIESMAAQNRIFNLLLVIVALVSLVVGGVGVMNVMLASVSERKQEIGIRKAMGATHADIQRLFLIESGLLSLMGGSLGTLFGFLLTYVVARLSDWPFHIQASTILSGFLVSGGTGIFFGFYPARRAAKLEPITTLRAFV